MKVIFMGTPDFAVPTLAALIASEHDVIAVYSQPPRPAGRGHKEQPSPVHQLAASHGIPVYHPVSLKGEAEQQAFAALSADVAVVAAYGLLLPPPILSGTRLGCINVHPSDLPRWRGAAPLQRTIMAGDATSAMCIMQMDVGLDTGDVLLRQSAAIPDNWNAGDLHDHMAQLGAAMILDTLAQHDSLTPAPQSADGVTYAHKITKEQLRINWSLPAREVLNHIRGLAPYPAATAMLGDELLKITQATLAEDSGAAGTALDDALLIACGDGALRITELQRAGKKRMSADEVLRGFAIPKGTSFD